MIGYNSSLECCGVDISLLFLLGVCGDFLFLFYVVVLQVFFGVSCCCGFKNLAAADANLPTDIFDRYKIISNYTTM